MKFALVFAAALVTALPVVSAPTASDAQVLIGRGRAASARRARPAPPPRLSDAEQDRLWDAQSDIETINVQIAELQAAGQAAGALTVEQQARLDAHNARRTELQAVVTQLEAKRDR